MMRDLALLIPTWLGGAGVLCVVMWLVWRGLPHVRGIAARTESPDEDPFEGRGPPR